MICHRDIKPENILINAEGYLRLTEFGFAMVIEHRTYTLSGTPEYLAPEVLFDKGWSPLTFERRAGIKDPKWRMHTNSDQ